MDLVQYYYIAEIVAALAVIASLLLVALQLSHNTAAIRISIGQSYIDKFLDMHRDIMHDRELAELLVAKSGKPEDLSPVEHLLLSNLDHLGLRQSEFMYKQYRDGNLDEELWQSWFEAMKANSRSPFSRWEWNRHRQPYSKQFTELMEGIYTEIEAETADRQPAS